MEFLGGNSGDGMAGGGTGIAAWTASFGAQRTSATKSSSAFDLLIWVKQLKAAAKEEKKI